MIMISANIEDYLTVDFYEIYETKERSPISLIMDLSDVKPAEIEIEDEIKMGYLWQKYSKKSK